MRHDLSLKLDLFGAFRQWVPDGEIELSVAEGSRVSDLRRALERMLREREPSRDPSGLLESSVFADDQAVLAETSALTTGMRIAVLPPVCGG